MGLYYYMCRSWQDCCRRGENRSWPSVSVESVDSECWCLNNAIFYAFIMRLTVEERGFILESYLKTFDVFPTVHHSIGYFFRTNFNAYFNMNMYVTLSSTCFGPWHAHFQEEQLHKHSIWYPRSTRRLHTTPVEGEDGHVKARNMSRIMWHTCSYWSVH